MLELKVERISKIFQKGIEKLSVLENIDFTILPGSICSIIGPSGCGKSTLIKIIAGLQKPSNGRVIVDSQKIEAPSKKISLILQEDSIFPWKTVLQNIKLPLEIKGVSKSEIEQKSDGLLKLMRLNGFENYYPSQISGGMRQRVALARALITNPEIILMDEPMATLDPYLREKLQEELLDIQKTMGFTIVLISHDIDEVVFLSDTIVVLTNRPAQIKASIKIDFKERKPSLRASNEFLKYKSEIWTILHN